MAKFVYWIRAIYHCHIGWNTVTATPDHPLFKGIEEGEITLLRSQLRNASKLTTIAQCDYGNPFTAAVSLVAYYGVQFHPERSSKAGSKLIQNFLEL